MTSVKIIKDLKTINNHMFGTEHYFSLVFVTCVEVKIKKIFKEKESSEISKILGLITNIEEYQKTHNHV